VGRVFLACKSFLRSGVLEAKGLRIISLMMKVASILFLVSNALFRCVSMTILLVPWRKSLGANLKMSSRLAISLVALVIVVGVLWAGYLWGIFWVFGEWSDRGSFGDAFGGINSIFSGLALGGVIIAIILQGRELELQREELRLTREEITKTVDVQRQSAAALAQQAAVSAIIAELNALVAITEPGFWKGVSGAPANLSQIKLQIPDLLGKIQEVREGISGT